MEAILNIPALNVELLDRVVATAYGGKEPEGKQARDLLVQFQEHELAWTKADMILETSQSMASKFLALSVLEQLVQRRWKILPQDQRDGIKNFIVTLIIKISQTPVTQAQQRTFLNKLDMVLVGILKHEWPHNWPSFIPDLVGSSNVSESLCENNMVILKLLSEEVFEFSAEQMVSQKVKNLKNEMCESFSQVFHLCMLVLGRATQPSLINATLLTLLRFLNWIPLGYIFETDLIPMLVEKYLATEQFRNATIKCLTEIASVNAGGAYTEQFRQLFNGSIVKLMTFLPLEMNLRQIFQTGSERDQQFIQDLANFLTAMLREHLRTIEAQEGNALNLNAHSYLLNISDCDDRETFKVCLDYWNKLVSELYTELPLSTASPLMLGSAPSSVRRELYAPLLSKLRVIMIEHMAKPEEVLVVENDVGEIVREAQKDTDTIALYKAMREVLIYLTHLNCEDMETIMMSKLLKQMDGSEWSFNNLSKLCWAIGSISGAMSEEEEKRFLVSVIKDLLNLVEMRRGKENKAVVAANIMYIVGQYPRFLKAHWKFLKTVVNKLFEFMHELHEGVQDMACDTFIKISQKCRKHFVVLQPGEVMPFIEEILQNLSATISDLQPQQVHTVYEAIGYMIQSRPEPAVQERLIGMLMDLPNRGWDGIIQKARVDVRQLEQVAVYKNAINVLHTNVSACSSIGQPFIVQISRIFLDMLALYRSATQLIAQQIQQQVAERGPNAPLIQTAIIKGLRGIKKESLKLLDSFIARTEDPKDVADRFVGPLLEAVLVDYAQTAPVFREADVLNLCATIVERLNGFVSSSIHPILDSVFACTLDMITKDFQEFPEHRTGFYKLLREINFHCFPSLLELPQPQFKLFVDSVVWGFKHTMRDIADIGLQITYELLDNVNKVSVLNPPAVAHFYQQYLLSIIQDVFFVLTDREHKSGFKLQAIILMQIFHLVEAGQIPVPLWDTAQQQPAGITNQVFVRNHIATLLRNAFNQVSDQQIQQFVNGLFDLNTDITGFKSSLRDFLIRLKEFAGEDNQLLFVEETEAELERKRQASMQIPGMVKPHDRTDDAMD